MTNEEREAVFEQAHTPTSQDAEVILTELSAWQRHTGDAALASMLRRTAAVICRSDVQLAEMTAEKEEWRIRCAEETIAWADEVTENRRLLAAEPQAEPSDAQVLAALNAFAPWSAEYHLSDWAEGNVVPMRAALSAAFKAGGEER